LVLRPAKKSATPWSATARAESSGGIYRGLSHAQAGLGYHPRRPNANSLRQVDRSAPILTAQLEKLAPCRAKSTYEKAVSVSDRFYQKYISVYTPACCRYYPTCSAYAVTAIERFGALRGGLLALMRILRATPIMPAGLIPFGGVGPPLLQEQKRSRTREDNQTCNS
jgi:putative membrane protein insertion efficiency factor